MAVIRVPHLKTMALDHAAYKLNTQALTAYLQKCRDVYAEEEGAADLKPHELPKVGFPLYGELPDLPDGHLQSVELLSACVKKSGEWERPKSHSQFLSHDAAMCPPVSDALEALAAPLIKTLEREVFGCYLVPYQLQIVETHVKSFKDRQINEQWHFDRTAHPNHKLFIYLSDVTKEDGPFQFVLNRKGDPHVDHHYVRGYGDHKVKGGRPFSATGRKGTSFFINTDVVHRRSIPTRNNRLAVILAIRPVYKKLGRFIDKRWLGDHARTWKRFMFKSMETERGLFGGV